MDRGAPVQLPQLVLRNHGQWHVTHGEGNVADRQAGSSRLAARAQADPGYLTASRERVERTQLELHAIAARIAVLWPQALGTFPWSLARLAQAATGLRYGIVVAGAAMRRRIDRATGSYPRPW